MSKYTQPQADTIELNGDSIPFKFKPCTAKEALDVQLAVGAQGLELADHYAIALPFVEAHLTEYDGEDCDVSRDLPVVAVTGIAAKIMMYRLMGKSKSKAPATTPSS